MPPQLATQPFYRGQKKFTNLSHPRLKFSTFDLFPPLIIGLYMKHLVLGGTGTIGSDVVRGLLNKGEIVRVLTRSEEKANRLPRGVTAVVGDLLSPATYPSVFKDFDHLFLLNAVTLTELHEGLAALNEAIKAGVKKIVYISVQDVEKGPAIPHFASKIAIEHAIKQSGIPYTILRPNNFYQNDYWFKDAILEYGIYPQPIGDAGLSRVDTRDIAEAAVNALTGPDHENKTYTLAGPDPLTGQECADIYSRELGREVQYAGDNLEEWQKQALNMLPDWMVYDFKLMYAVFQKKGLVANGQQLKETVSIVGNPPRSFPDFARETVEYWTRNQ